MVKHPLIYSGVGIYQPHVTPTGIVWQRNTDGQPLVGVQVENIANVRKFAQLVRIEAFEKQEQEQ